MRAPLSWLQSLTPLAVAPTDRAAVAGLSAELDSLGLVVEDIEWVGEGLGDVVVARVLEIAAIEGADRIRRVLVDAGGDDSVEVVCGAWNFGVGDIVPLAPVGAVLPGGFRMERRKMKGVVSNGMICSARELALGDDHEGILVLGSAGLDGPLPAGVELGRSLGDHLGVTADVVFDLAIEPNRPDCLCMLGVARDLAAHFGLPLETPEPVLQESDPPAAGLASVSVRSPELCWRFTGRVLTGVVPAPSPRLVQRRLTLAGMRPINAVVDASNYVMLELGQPTHPYDLDRLGGGGLLARAARPGEQLRTLDGELRTLGERRARPDDPTSGLDCLICDAGDQPVGIGGVMGGRESEVDDTTSRVLLEAALFRPVSVGRTARAVGLRTEASVRFERGVDPAMVERASARVCELVVEAALAAGLAPPAIARGLLDDHPVAKPPVRIRVRPERVNALLGTDLTAAKMQALLEPIGYSSPGAEAPASGDDGAFEVLVPTFRPDVQREVDVAEDVARRFGYRNIARTQRRSPSVGRLDEIQRLRRQIRRLLCGLGAHEAWTSSIVDPATERRAGWDGGLVTLANPMVAEESALRSGLLGGLLGAVRHNSGHRHPFVRLFEIGDVFAPAESGGAMPVEHERVALVLAGEGDGAASAVQSWRVVEDALRLQPVAIEQSWNGSEGDGHLAGLHRTRSAQLVRSDGGVLGRLGEVDPDVVSAFGLPHERIGWLDLDIGLLATAARRSEQARPVSRFPSSDVDLAFVVDEGVAASRLEETLRAAGGELLESVELFDVYRGPGVEEGKRSLAFRLRFCAQDHTLTDAEVAAARSACIEAVEGRLEAVLRS